MKNPATEGRRKWEEPYVLDDQVGFVLRQAQQRHTTIFATEMIEDLTPTQWAALAKLRELGACSQNHLGRRTAMDAATIKGVIDRLTARGFTATGPDPRDARRLAGLAAKEQPPCPDTEDDQGLGDHRFDEPALLKQALSGLKYARQDPEGYEIEDGADRTEDHHEAFNQLDVPLQWLDDRFRIDVIERYRDLGNVVDQVVEQDLGSAASAGTAGSTWRRPC